MNPTVEAVADPLATACESKCVLDEVNILVNPRLGNYHYIVTLRLERIVVYYGSKKPEIIDTSLDSEPVFERIVKSYCAPVITADETEGTAAVDVTLGQKLISAIAFQVGIQFWRIFPNVPGLALNLIDFQEVF